MSTKDTEREHCEAVARRFTSAHTIGEITDDLAGIILRERAAAREAALEEAAALIDVSDDDWAMVAYPDDALVDGVKRVSARRIRALKVKP